MITMKAELHSACYGVERAEVGGHSAVYKTKNKNHKNVFKEKEQSKNHKNVFKEKEQSG